MSISNRLEKHFAVCAAVVATAAVVGTADAAIVTWYINMVVPANIDGLYINVETQTVGSSGGTVAGWDINPYGSTAMQFYNAAGTGMQRFLGVTTGSAGNLALGTGVSQYGSMTGSGDVVFGTNPGNWQLNATNYFAFKFRTAADGTTGTHYGYGAMVVGATAAIRTLAFIQWNQEGFGIVVVPAPGAIALIGLAGLVSRRRRR